MDSATLKPEVDKTDIDNLKIFPADLTKISNLVSNVVKKTLYDKSVTKVNEKLGLEKKINDADRNISDTGGLVQKIDCKNQWNKKKTTTKERTKKQIMMLRY